MWERRAAAKETEVNVRELFVTSCWAVIGSVPKWLFAREGQLMKSSFWKKGTYYILVPQFGVLEIVCLFWVVKSGPKLGLIFGTGSETGIRIGSLLRTRFSESGSQFYLCVKWELEVEPTFLKKVFLSNLGNVYHGHLLTCCLILTFHSNLSSHQKELKF